MARILYVSLSLAHKSLALTLLPHALANEQVVLPLLDTGMQQKQSPSSLSSIGYGTIIEQVTVRKVENGLGLWCSLASMPGTPGFAHVSRKRLYAEMH